MAYQDHFRLADDYISHLDSALVGIQDPFIRSRYVGFVALSAATVFELAIKDIFCTFGVRKHKVLGNFTSVYFYRLNGRIKRDEIQKTYLKLFGDKYVHSFVKKLDRAEQATMRASRESIKNSYNNLLTWRHQFAHEGTIPNTATYEEVKRAYTLGRKLVECLADSLKR